MNKMAFYYESEKLDVVLAAEKIIEKKLREDELKLALECATQMPAFATLTYADGSALYVARKRCWNAKANRYEYKVQLLGGEDKLASSVDIEVDGLIVFASVDYYEKDGKFYRLDGYEVCPLMHIAYLAVRAGRRGVGLIPQGYNR